MSADGWVVADRPLRTFALARLLKNLVSALFVVLSHGYLRVGFVWSIMDGMVSFGYSECASSYILQE